MTSVVVPGVKLVIVVPEGLSIEQSGVFVRDAAHVIVQVDGVAVPVVMVPWMSFAPVDIDGDVPQEDTAGADPLPYGWPEKAISGNVCNPDHVLIADMIGIVAPLVPTGR